MPNAKQKTSAARKTPAVPKAIQAFLAKPLLTDVRTLILDARERTAQTVNAGLTLLYWNIGMRIHQDILNQKRAEYGQAILQSLSAKLVEEFGRGYSAQTLRHTVRFAEAFPDEKIVSALLRQLSWTHFLSIIYLDDPLKRDFYAEMCRS